MQPVKTLKDGLQVEDSNTPLYVTAVVSGPRLLTEYGTTHGDAKVVHYVNLEALPVELQERIKTVIQIMLHP